MSFLLFVDLHGLSVYEAQHLCALLQVPVPKANSITPASKCEEPELFKKVGKVSKSKRKRLQKMQRLTEKALDKVVKKRYLQRICSEDIDVFATRAGCRYTMMGDQEKKLIHSPRKTSRSAQALHGGGRFKKRQPDYRFIGASLRDAFASPGANEGDRSKTGPYGIACKSLRYKNSLNRRKQLQIIWRTNRGGVRHPMKQKKRGQFNSDDLCYLFNSSEHDEHCNDDNDGRADDSDHSRPKKLTERHRCRNDSPRPKKPRDSEEVESDTEN